MKKKLPAYVVLLAITLIAGIVLGGTYTITKDPITAESARKMEEARKAALPEADTFRLVRETTPDGMFGSASAQGKVGPVYVEVNMDPSGAITALAIGDENYAETPEYAAEVQEDAFVSQFIGKKAPFAIASSNDSANPADGYVASVGGFAGPVAVQVTFDENNVITAFSIGDDKFSETPDYGGKALDPAFAQQFIGKQAPLTLDDIDAISGATITSKAVVNATNKAYNIANATPIDAVTGATVTCEAVVEAVNNAAATDTGMDWCYEGIKDGQVVGYVAQTNVKGFGGKVEVIVGVNRDQQITGISVGGANFSETAGLGAKAKEAGFTNQFIGKDATESIGVIKAGNPKGDNDVDAITAATITSSAVAGGVNSIAAYSSGLIASLPKPPVVMVKPDVTYTSSSKGYAGPVDAEVGFDEDGYIVYLVVGQSDKFAESEGFGANARSTDFTDQFIGLSGDVTIDEIDAISGATITSEAVVNSVNKSYKKFLDANAPAEQAPASNAPVADASPAATSEFSGSSKGYGGPVQITATFDADGKIATLVIGGDKFAESQGIGDKALDPAFAAQFIGKQAPIALTDIDAISGATVTSEAVVNAINKAYDKFKAAAPASAPAASAPAQDVPATGNVFSASSKGYGGPVQVTASFDAEGKITSLSIGGDKFAESEGIGDKALNPAFAQQFIGKQAPVTIGDIDAISGATVTSEAVVSAVNKAYNKFLGQ
ncbi:MAG: FMN-binding protein [Clostridia bacterium]|nr:FMN-binding protein [Clostridia bacterium]